MGGRGRGSGQAARQQRDDESNFPGVGGNKFPDTSASHVKYDGGRTESNPYGSVNHDAVKADIQRRFGVGAEEAEDMYDGVRAFTGAPYSEIRAAQKNGDTTSYYGRQGANAERFIEAGIKSGNGWKGGVTYRGVAVDDATLEGFSQIPNGSDVNIHLGGSASWATRVGVAQGFAEDNEYGPMTNKVVFVNMDSTQRGVSVAGISSSGYGEREVLCSKDAKFTKVGQRRMGEYTYIYVRNS